jgi:hypothetical protein
LTARAATRGLGLLFLQGLGLAGEAQVEHPLRQDVADFHQEGFEVGQGGAPGRAVGAVELIDQVFGDALDVGPHRFRLRRALLGSRHPWVLSVLVAKARLAFLSGSVRTQHTVCKPCRAPFADSDGSFHLPVPGPTARLVSVWVLGADLV